jgi:hypothetical protein
MINIFGAYAKVYLKHTGDIKEVASKISKGLVLPNFSVEFNEYPPYDLIGSCETLGFEVWLNKVPSVNGYNFVFEMRTGISHEELFLDQMHDLSPWMARYIARICDVDTFVSDQENNTLEFTAGLE